MFAPNVLIFECVTHIKINLVLSCDSLIILRYLIYFRKKFYQKYCGLLIINIILIELHIILSKVKYCTDIILARIKVYLHGYEIMIFFKLVNYL